ncbi:MAG: DUF4180 domain-containing protein [Prolixibacteraceae bacterium]|jgi:hypothetical protein|nr:DUF4180 domain-containing protein [Prolixibacteraceae bacterium]
MKIRAHTLNGAKIAEVISDDIVINTPQDGLDLLGDIYYQGFDRLIIHEKNLTEDFFDLKNGIAGEILQKFSNYRIRLAIVGNFEEYTRKSIRDFIYESNKIGQINFTDSLSGALSKLS